MDQEYSNFIEIKYEALFDSLKKCEELEYHKIPIIEDEIVYRLKRIDVLEDTSKPRPYRPKSPPSDEYIKRKYLEILHEIEVIIKIKKNLKEFGHLKNFLERKDEILLNPEECIEEIKRINISKHYSLGSNIRDKLLEFCTPDFFSPEKQRARGKVKSDKKKGKYRNIAKFTAETVLSSRSSVTVNDIKIEMEKLYLSTDINGLYYPNDEGMKFIGKYEGPIEESSLRKSIKRGIGDFGIKICN